MRELRIGRRDVAMKYDLETNRVHSERAAAVRLAELKTTYSR
jgi:hypothetical protein